jgi:hypothetical protein
MVHPMRRTGLDEGRDQTTSGTRGSSRSLPCTLGRKSGQKLRIGQEQPVLEGGKTSVGVYDLTSSEVA